MDSTNLNTTIARSGRVLESEDAFGFRIAPLPKVTLRGLFGDAYRDTRVLVTGHTGFKGSWLSFWLRHLGAHVTGFAVDVPTTPSNFEVLDLSGKMYDCRGDIRDFRRLSEVFEESQPEIVFHLAAQPIVRTSYADPKTTFDTNVGGTVNVLECIRTHSSVKAAVLITSDKCYENVEWEYGYREIDRLGGKDPYSASKACAEIAISTYARSYFSAEGKRIASARAGNVIGGGDWAADRIVPDCARAWSRGDAVNVRNPASTRPWQHVLEPLGGYLWLGAQLLGDTPGIAGEAFNFGPKDDVGEPVERVIEVMARVCHGMRWSCDGRVQGKAEADLLKLCCDKAESRLGWKGALAFDEAVEMAAEWYRAYYGGKSDMKSFAAMQIDAYASISASRGMAWAK